MNLKRSFKEYPKDFLIIIPVCTTLLIESYHFFFGPETGLYEWVYVLIGSVVMGMVLRKILKNRINRKKEKYRNGDS